MASLDSLVGQAIAQQRHALGLSQERLAHDCDLHRTYISQLERGVKSPTLRVFFKIANVLKLKPSELMRRVEGGR